MMKGLKNKKASLSVRVCVEIARKRELKSGTLQGIGMHTWEAGNFDPVREKERRWTISFHKRDKCGLCTIIYTETQSQTGTSVTLRLSSFRSSEAHLFIPENKRNLLSSTAAPLTIWPSGITP